MIQFIHPTPPKHFFSSRDHYRGEYNLNKVCWKLVIFGLHAIVYINLCVYFFYGQERHNKYKRMAIHFNKNRTFSPSFYSNVIELNQFGSIFYDFIAHLICYWLFTDICNLNISSVLIARCILLKHYCFSWRETQHIC